jgi:hypothetical protein
MVPMAGQDAIINRAPMEWKSKMWAAVIEGKHLPIIIDNEQRTASSANDDHARGLQFLQRRDSKEISREGGKVFADPHLGH